jgi:pyruvate dehydrogenase E2 component (dihydrolipoamide acetyltransferase)
MTAVENFQPVINPPQAMILGVSRPDLRLVFAEEGDGPGGQGRWAKMMKVTVSCDHRVIDGAVAAKWLGSLKQYIENPLMLAL